MRALLLGALLALTAPASAIAATQYYIPPGNSGGNQYLESVPTAGGSSPTTGVTHRTGGGSGSRGTLSQGTRSALLRSGRDGANTAAFANATGPQAATSTGGRLTSSSAGGTGQHAGGGVGGSGIGRDGGTASAGQAGRPPAGTSPLASVARSVTGLGGHGGVGLLPWVLVVIAVGLGGVALRRRHAG